MGAYTCQFGVVHKVCRCPTPHTIRCDKPLVHGGVETAPEHLCLVMKMRLDGRLPMPKHMAEHLPHDWWYTASGGGHQMDSYDPLVDTHEKNVKKWHCPGWKEV